MDPHVEASEGKLPSSPVIRNIASGNLGDNASKEAALRRTCLDKICAATSPSDRRLQAYVAANPRKLLPPAAAAVRGTAAAAEDAPHQKQPAAAAATQQLKTAAEKQPNTAAASVGTAAAKSHAGRVSTQEGAPGGRGVGKSDDLCEVAAGAMPGKAAETTVVLLVGSQVLATGVERGVLQHCQRVKHMVQVNS